MAARRPSRSPSHALAEGGAGEFSFHLHADTGDPGPLQEDIGVHSRWDATGAGRADVRAQGGDLGAVVVTVSECWDTSFARVYYTDSASWTPTEGDAAACGHPDAVYPTFDE